MGIGSEDGRGRRRLLRGALRPAEALVVRRGAGRLARLLSVSKPLTHMPASYRIDLRAGVVFSAFEGQSTTKSYWTISNDCRRTPSSGQR